MSHPVVVLIITQLLFTGSDLLARSQLSGRSLTTVMLFTPWFLLFTILRVVATGGQLFVFTQLELSRTMALFGAVSIILSSILGWLVLKEILPPVGYVGVTLAIIAFFILWRT